MIDGYSAAYLSFAYQSQTTSTSLSFQQSLSGDNGSESGEQADAGFSYSLGYTTTTTVSTVSLLYVQESANSNETDDHHEAEGDNGPTALQTVLAGPTDPFNPLETGVPVVNTALDILDGLIESLQVAEKDGEENNSDRGNKNGHAVRDANYGHTKDQAQAAYSIAEYDVTTTTTTTEISLVA